MPGAYLMGWDATNSKWVKCLVTAEGKLIIDPTEIFENTPTDNEHGKAPDSDWAHDHAANASAHHAKTTAGELNHNDLANIGASDHHVKYEHPAGIQCNVRNVYASNEVNFVDGFNQDNGIIYFAYRGALKEIKEIRFLEGMKKNRPVQIRGKFLGGYSAKAVNTEYEAGEDGFVVAYAYTTSNPSRGYIFGREGAVSGALTSRGRDTFHWDTASDTLVNNASVTFPVKKGNYWNLGLTLLEGTATAVVTWVSMG